MRQHRQRFAAQQHAGHTFAAMGGHHNPIAFVFFGGLDDGLGHRAFAQRGGYFHVPRVAFFDNLIQAGLRLVAPVFFNARGFLKRQRHRALKIAVQVVVQRSEGDNLCVQGDRQRQTGVTALSDSFSPSVQIKIFS